MEAGVVNLEDLLDSLEVCLKMDGSRWVIVIDAVVKDDGSLMYDYEIFA